MDISKDYLPNHPEIVLYQSKKMFKLNSDTVNLGEFLEVYKEDTVLDIGTNQGVLLLYASFFKPAKLIGIDFNKEALALAKRNLDENKVENYELIHADINDYQGELVDVIICNPPFFKGVSKNDYLQKAKHEESLPLKNLIKAINNNLKQNGTVYILYQSSRFLEIAKELQNYHIEPKEIKFIYDENKLNSHSVLIKAVRGQKAHLVIRKPIIIKRILK